MIKRTVIEYKLDSENYICGYQRWNPDRDIDNTEYQNFIASIKNNPEPIEEMNQAYKNHTHRIYNKHTGNYYRLVDNIIITVAGIDEVNEFSKIYSNRALTNMILKGIDNRNDSVFTTFKNAFLSILNIRPK